MLFGITIPIDSIVQASYNTCKRFPVDARVEFDVSLVFNPISILLIKEKEGGNEG